MTPVTADTMNDLNRLHYTILSDPADAAAVRTALSVAPLGVTAGTSVQVDQAVTATTRSATTTLGTSLNHTLSDTSTTITAFNGVTGVTYSCRALGAGSITHHATDLIITQGSASLTTAAGMTFDVEMITSTTSRIKNVHKADGTALVVAAASGVTSVSGTSPVVSSGGATPAISIPAATASVAGHMTAAYASKLDGIAAGANVGVTTDQGHNNVGSFVFASGGTTVSITEGGTHAGSGLFAAGVSSVDGTAPLATKSATALSGTWRALGFTGANTGTQGYTLFQRIA